MYDRDTKTLKELEANPRAIEKVARERYFMKKPNEDIYVFKEQ
jgi:cell division protein FtsB